MDKNGPAVRFNFSINQHKRDYQVLHAFKNFFGCGRISKEYYTEKGRCFNNNGPYIRFEISNRKHLREKVIPFFNENELNTKKHNSFKIWSDLLEKTEKGFHLATSERTALMALKQKMNLGVDPKMEKLDISNQ